MSTIIRITRQSAKQKISHPLSSSILSLPCPKKPPITWRVTRGIATTPRATTSFRWPSIATNPLRKKIDVHGHSPLLSFQTMKQQRMIHTESKFHDIADETLETIQEKMEDFFMKHDTDGEVDVSSGVLTLSLGNKGTWVINKQTPNRQIWWSSPISGPMRYEYHCEEGREEEGLWVFSRFLETVVGEEFDDTRVEENSLGYLLGQEIKQVFGEDLELKC